MVPLLLPLPTSTTAKTPPSLENECVQLPTTPDTSPWPPSFFDMSSPSLLGRFSCHENGCLSESELCLRARLARHEKCSLFPHCLYILVVWKKGSKRNSGKKTNENRPQSEKRREMLQVSTLTHVRTQTNELGFCAEVFLSIEYSHCAWDGGLRSRNHTQSPSKNCFFFDLDVLKDLCSGALSDFPIRLRAHFLKLLSRNALNMAKATGKPRKTNRETNVGYQTKRESNEKGVGRDT